MAHVACNTQVQLHEQLSYKTLELLILPLLVIVCDCFGLVLRYCWSRSYNLRWNRGWNSSRRLQVKTAAGNTALVIH